jgi:LAS superfamily LD-carboxypeptidase LdcB
MSTRPPPDAALLTGRSRAHLIELPELGCTLHHGVIEPFLALRAAAAGEGIDLRVASSFRDFERQRIIWNDKFCGRRPLLDRKGRVLDVRTLDTVERIEAILAWSALPGASRHHWGTDLDVYDAAAMPDVSQLRLVAEEYSSTGPFARLDAWLERHLGGYGFFRPYQPAINEPVRGVSPEPWHLSFAPLAATFLSASTPQLLADTLQEVELEGRELVLQRIDDIHHRYVANITAPPRESLAFEVSEHRRVI